MKPKEVFAFLKSIVHYDETPSIFIWGAPGIGKSDVVKQITKEEKIGFIDIRLSLMDPTDLRGIPIPENGKAKWLQPSELPMKGEGILFFDELNLAPPLVQSAALQIVLNRKIGEYNLPQGWRVIAAGNKTEHGANTYKMAAPLRNRFVHIEFEVDKDNWIEWAIKNEVISEVVEFINFRPGLLFQFDPTRYENAFPTPRSWEFVSKILKSQNGLDEEIIHKVIEGTVGQGAAIEFKGYLKIKENLPAIDNILKGEDFIPSEIDVSCALVTALVIKAETGQFNRLLSYSEKLQSEVAVLLGKLLVLKNKEELLKCSLWPAWSKKHYSLII